MAGLKTLAKELQSKGRNGDTVLAHINPQEAGILKALGGSGTINPDTGLPEYFLKKITQPIVQGVKAIQNVPGIKQVSDVATQAVKPFDQALVGLDKTVGKVIPGGWETVGQVALSAMGVPTQLQVAYGAARGGGMLRPGSSLKNVNLQGAIIGGATAYAQAKLGEYLQGASDAAVETGTKSLTDAVKEATFDPKTLVDTGMIESTDKAALNALAKGIEEGAGKGLQVAPPPSIGSELLRGNFSNIADRGLSSLENFGTSAVEGVKDFGKAAINPETYTGALDRGVTNAGKTVSGIGNLLTGGSSVSTVDPLKMGALTLYGETSLSGLDEQRKYLEASKRANAISQAEYDAALGEINRQRDIASDVVSRNPFNPNPSRDVSIGETFYGRSGEGENLYDRMQSNLYAMGGQVDDELGGDYSAMGMDQGNMQKGLFGMGYAEGGTPRFLSGGGDGMSDSIKATINEKQPARLADGEFVIPADVVSHLGNGSSKAGAKQLYAMMDRVRSARTGRKSQGKQINPRKYMTA
jgi:hypothetical protein